MKVKQTVEEELVLYRNIFQEMKKQKVRQKLCFSIVTQSVPAFPSISSTSATPETAGPTPLPPLPQPT